MGVVAPGPGFPLPWSGDPRPGTSQGTLGEGRPLGRAPTLLPLRAGIRQKVEGAGGPDSWGTNGGQRQRKGGSENSAREGRLCPQGQAWGGGRRFEAGVDLAPGQTGVPPGTLRPCYLHLPFRAQWAGLQVVERTDPPHSLSWGSQLPSGRKGKPYILSGCSSWSGHACLALILGSGCARFTGRSKFADVE